MIPTEISFEITMDAHSREVRYHGERVGMLLFHDWIFKLDLEGDHAPIELELAAGILEKAKKDPGIQDQRVTDSRNAMVESARHFLISRGFTKEALDVKSAKELIALYFQETEKPPV